MLGEARQYLQQDRTLDPSRYLLLRADVGRMPFATGSGAQRSGWLVVGWGGGPPPLLCKQFVEWIGSSCFSSLPPALPPPPTPLPRIPRTRTTTTACSGRDPRRRRHPLLAQPRGGAGRGVARAAPRRRLRRLDVPQRGGAAGAGAGVGRAGAPAEPGGCARLACWEGLPVRGRFGL